VIVGLSGLGSDAAPLIRHGLRWISSSSTAVFSTAFNNR
jgi:hypothetical protein